jgi:hypothetical protein
VKETKPIEKKSVKIEGQKGDIITGTLKPKAPPAGPPTIETKNQEIKKETALAKALRERINKKSWRGKQQGNQFIIGEDSGILAWLNPLFCAVFGCVDVGYKKNLRIWNFPPDVDNPKKKHTVSFQYFYQLENKYVLVDVFNDKTPSAKIRLIKAWLEALGYRYTYFTGADREMAMSNAEGFADLIFKKRLAVLDPKAKDFPKFKVPKTYAEANLPYGGQVLIGAMK